MGFMGPEGCTIWKALLKDNIKFLLLENIEDKCPWNTWAGPQPTESWQEPMQCGALQI